VFLNFRLPGKHVIRGEKIRGTGREKKFVKTKTTNITGRMIL